MYENSEGGFRRSGHAGRAPGLGETHDAAHGAHGFTRLLPGGGFHARGDGAAEPRPGTTEDSDALDYSAFFRNLWRRKFLLVGIAALATSLAAAIIVQLPSHYIGHALVVVGDSSVTNRSGRDASPAPTDPGAVQTYVELLKSPQLAAEVVRRLHLETNPEFNPALVERDQTGLMARVKGMISRVGAWCCGWQERPAAPVEPAVALSRTVDVFLHHLTVSIKENSRMIDVAFDSADPQLAMRVANTLVDSYVSEQLELRAQLARRTSDWLRDRIGQLQAEVENSERAVQKFRAENGLFSMPGGAPLLLKQMTDVSAELATAQSARGAIEARLRQLRAALKAAGRNGKTGDIAEIIDSPLMRTLDTEQAKAQQQLAELSAKYGDKYPLTVGVMRRLNSIHTAMRRETQRVLAGIENDLRIARMKEQNLSQRLARLKNDVSHMNGAGVSLSALEHKAQADRVLLNDFISRFQAISQKTDASSLSADAQIASYAQLPVSPERPKKFLLILVAGIVGLIGAVVVVLTIEKSDRSLHSLKEIESYLKIAGLGMLPVSKSAQLSAPEAARYGTAYREALKATYLSLFGRRDEPRVTAVTSALPGEGKTTLALSLAAMAAQSGQRVILLDADFWKKGASEALGFRAGAGLAEVLEGKAGLSDVIISDAVLGADIMLPGRFSRGSLLAWVNDFRELLATLRNLYAVVIIDAPPVLSASEAALLAKYADATVMAVRWGSTSRDLAAAASRKLHDAGALLAGSVLTMVDEREHASYGYTEATYFSRAFETYQSSPTGAISHASMADDSGDRASAEARKKKRAGSHALLVIDMQKNLGSTAGWHSLSKVARDGLIESINRVSDVAAKSGMLVLYAQQELGRFAARNLAQASTTKTATGNAMAIRPDPCLTMVSELCFDKPAPDAFSNANFNNFLRQQGVDHLFIVGVDGVTSIKQTAHSALDRGYRVTFIRDGIFTSSETRWRRMLKFFESSAAFAITREEFAEFCHRLGKDVSADLASAQGWTMASNP